MPSTRTQLVGRAAAVALVLLGAVSWPATSPVRAADAVDMRAGPNYRLGADPENGRGRDAPGLAVHPTDSRHIVEVEIEVFAGDCEYHVSFDAGQTWTGGVLRAPDGFPPQLCATGAGTAAMDSSVAFGSGQTVYTTLSVARSGEGRTALVMKSTDGGRTFAPGVVAMAAGPSNTGPSFLLPKLVVEPRPAGDRIYLAARRGSETVVSVSEDGGATWSPPVLASGAGESAIEQSQPVLLADGTVAVSWRTSGTVGSIVVARSSDGGQTWARAQAAAVRGYESNTASSFPRMAADPASGTLYVVYGQGPEQQQSAAAQPSRETQDHFIHPDSDVLIVRSTDRGATWSAPVRVNDDTLRNNIAQRHPNVSIGQGGRIDVVWHDRRHSYKAPTNSHGGNGEARLGDTYYAYSLDGGRTFSPNHRITDRTINNDLGLDYRSGTYWSFGPVSVPVGTDRVLFAWMDSREANFDIENQDIYLASMRVGAAGATPVETVTASGPASLSVVLSRRAFPAGGEAVLDGTFTNRAITKVAVVNQEEAATASAAAVLARATLGPLLLSPAAGLPDDVKDEVERLKPVGALVVGNETALSAQVVADLEASGVRRDTIVRLAGTPGAQTARRVAEAMDTRTAADRLPMLAKPAFDAAVIVNPATPIAPAATALAADRRLPVLFVARDDVPQDTADALAALSIRATLVVGGTDEVSDAVVGRLPAPRRLADAGAVLAESRARGLPVNIVHVADSARPVDVAVLGAAAGRIGGVLVATAGASTSTAQTLLTAAGFPELVDRFVSVSPAAPAEQPSGRVVTNAPGQRDPLPATGGTAMPAGAGAAALLAVILRRLRR